MVKLEIKDVYEETLKAVQKHFGGVEETCFESPANSSCNVFIFPEIKGERDPGILCKYDDGCFYLSTNEEGYVAEVFRERTLDIRSNDNKSSCPDVSFKISTPSEIEDLKDFFYYSTDYTNDDFLLVDKTKFVKTTMADLIENVFLAIFINREAYLVDLKYYLEADTELAKTLRGAFSSKNIYEYFNKNVGKPSDFFKKQRSELKQFKKFGSNKKDIMFETFNDINSLGPADLISLEITLNNFIIRLKEDVPYSFFRQIVLKTTLYEKMEKALDSKNPLENLMAISFKAPSDRYHRLRYAFTMNALSQEIKNLSAQLPHIKAPSPQKVHAEMIKRIDTIKNLL